MVNKRQAKRLATKTITWYNRAGGTQKVKTLISKTAKKLEQQTCKDIASQSTGRAQHMKLHTKPSMVNTPPMGGRHTKREAEEQLYITLTETPWQ